VILLVTVIVLAVNNYNREKQYMSDILSEKGIALITALEAGARTGMMGMMWGGQQIQTLIRETSRLPDVLYITITNMNGVVLASNYMGLIGTQLNVSPDYKGIEPSEKAKWRVVDSENQQHSFEVYKYFKPITNRDEWMKNPMHQMMQRRGMMMGSTEDWCCTSGAADDQQIILVGLDPTPFEHARKEDLRNTGIISAVLVTLGLAGFISMFWMQSYRSTKKSLQDTSAIAKEVVTSLPVGLIASDKDGNLAFHNSAAERITGLHLSESRGKRLEDMLPNNFCGLKEFLDRDESIFEKEMECVFTEDKIVPVSISASKIINEEGHFIGKVFIIRDLGEIRRLQDEIRRKEKLAAVGRLAAGVAHEIRNPLSSLKGIASYFKNRSDEDSGDKDMAGVMIVEVDRMNRVISELLDFAKPTDIQRRTTDVNTLLEHSVRLIENEASTKGVSVSLDLNKQPLTAEIDSDRLSQCLLNLYLNALQSMEKGGRLSVKDYLMNDSYIVIDISDTGPGIEAKQVGQIFDPYFTTKAKGTGLGLAIVHKIIEAHDGNITVRSIIGEGTTFTLQIPVNKI
jgi:two-component system sensor histidine kinase HydH